MVGISTSTNPVLPPSLTSLDRHDLNAFLTIDEAATLLRCSDKSLRRRVSSGLYPELRGPGGRLLFVRSDLLASLAPSPDRHQRQDKMADSCAASSVQKLALELAGIEN